MTQEIVFLGLPFFRLPFDQAVEALVSPILNRTLQRLYFCNAHTVVTCWKNPALVKALLQADHILADGSGVLWSSWLLGKPLRHNLNGTDLIPALCQRACGEGLSVYFLGAKPGVAQAAAQGIAASCPFPLHIAGIQDGYFLETEIEGVLQHIRDTNPHLLLVALGVPHQELWIDRYSPVLPGIACVGVGGLFDFMAQRVVRAPLWLRSIGMEWIWRLAMEPRRLGRRYTLGNLEFLYLVLRYGFTRRGLRVLGSPPSDRA